MKQQGINSYPKKLYPFQSKRIDINGNDIHYIDEGKGEIILFFHPPVASSFMYRNMIRQLSQNYRCLVFDFPDFGLSSAAPGFQHSIQSYSEIAEKFIEKLQLKNFFLVMQEIGGHAALSAIIKQPENMSGIIITDTIIFPVSEYPRIRSMLNIVNSRVFNFINSNFNFLIRAMTKFGFRKRKLTREERNTYIEMFDTKVKRRRATFLLHELVIQEQLLKNIQNAFETVFNNMPTLIIYGEKDPLTSMKIPQRIKSILKNTELHVIKGEAHFPHEGTPDEMCKIIRNWIQ